MPLRTLCDHYRPSKSDCWVNKASGLIEELGLALVYPCRHFGEISTSRAIVMCMLIRDRFVHQGGSNFEVLWDRVPSTRLMVQN